MLKNLIAAVLASTGVASAMAAPTAAPTFKCDPAVLQVVADSNVTQYSIKCSSAESLNLAPVLEFTGEVQALRSPPYFVDATYKIDTLGLYATKMGEQAREDQFAYGRLTSATESLASLPAQFVAQTHWDSKAGVLSIQDRPGVWHAYSIQMPNDLDGASGTVVDAGLASAPVMAGSSTFNMVFDKTFSRFAGTGGNEARLTAKLGMQDGKLVVLSSDSREAAAKLLSQALSQLDKKPKDMTRAWSLGSRAKFLGLDQEVRYTEQKVAAHNPHLLEDFQRDLQRIKPFELPQLGDGLKQRELPFRIR